jgi:hypothetical protein
MPERKLNILDLISDSVANTGEEKVPKYLDQLYAAISDYTQKIRRDSLLVLVLVAAFELVNSSPDTKFSVASFSFNKGSIVLQFVPAVVAYLFLQIITDSIRLADMGITFRRLFSRWLGGEEILEASGLIEAGGFIMPATPLYWNIKQSLPSKDIIQYRRYSLEYWTSTGFTVVLVAGILAFEGHAYYILYSGQSTPDALWWISLCFTIACLVISAINFIRWYITAHAKARHWLVSRHRPSIRKRRSR